jgi:hypothetical protein
MADMREFILRISYESIDFRDATNEDPLLQFPYQSILCWGHNHRSVRYIVLLLLSLLLHSLWGALLQHVSVPCFEQNTEQTEHR